GVFHGYAEVTDNSVMLFLALGKRVVLGCLETGLDIWVQLVRSNETAVRPGSHLVGYIVQVLLSFGNSLVVSPSGFTVAEDENAFLGISNDNMLSGSGLLFARVDLLALLLVFGL